VLEQFRVLPLLALLLWQCSLVRVRLTSPPPDHLFWKILLVILLWLVILWQFLFWIWLPSVGSGLVTKGSVVVVEGLPLPLHNYDYLQLEYQGA
jgi:hypothetical protein